MANSDGTLPAPADVTACPIAPGTVMAGRYTVEVVIGDGTFGWVLSALVLTAAQPHRVALKVLRPEHARIPGALERFQARELCLLRRITEAGPAPNVVRVLEPSLFTHQGFSFIVLELIDGPSLRERCENGPPLARNEAARLGLGIARGLAALHDVGIIHRDLKPDNIRLRGGTEPVLVDLGIAAALDITTALTAPGGAAMTPRYAAPEQREGRSVNASCDVYALGLILEEMKVPGRVSAIARRCLERDPARRPSAADVAAEIAAFLRSDHIGRRAAITRGLGILASCVIMPCLVRGHDEVEPPTPSPPSKPGRKGHTAMLLANGDVLVVGGYDYTGKAFLSTAERYAPMLDQWVPAGLIGARSRHAAVLLANGEVLIVGGIGPSGFLADAARYAPDTNTWTTAAPMGSARARAAVAIIPGINRVLVTGGCDAKGSSVGLVELYDPATDRWTAAAPMTVARSSHVALWIPEISRILVLGGIGGRGFSLESAEMYDPEANAWTSIPPMSTGRSDFTATRLADERVLVAGGSRNGTRLKSAEIFDPMTAKWSQAAPMNAARYQHAATLLADRRVLVAGGAVSTDDVEIYDPSVDQWTRVSSRRWTTPTVTLLADGCVLIVDGSGTAPLTWIRLDPASMAPIRSSHRWTLIASMYTPRARHTMTALPDGRVLVVGSPFDTSINDAELYDPKVDTWSPPIPMTAEPPGRFGATATLRPGTGTVLVAGGGHKDGVQFSAELYDLSQNLFRGAARMATYRKLHTATILKNGHVLVAGGYGGRLHADTERYDPVRDVWTSSARMRVARQQHIAVMLSDGHVLVAGGLNQDNQVERSCELYDPATDTWTPGPSLASPRTWGIAVLLRDNRVFFAGGHGNETTRVGAEIYDPTSGRWQPTAPMHEPRDDYAVLLLSSGDVMVAGGIRNGAPLDSVEIYDPVRNSWMNDTPMLIARSEAAAVLLAGGRVLVTGGKGEGGVLLSSAEIAH